MRDVVETRNPAGRADVRRERPHDGICPAVVRCAKDRHAQRRWETSLARFRSVRDPASSDVDRAGLSAKETQPGVNDFILSSVWSNVLKCGQDWRRE